MTIMPGVTANGNKPIREFLEEGANGHLDYTTFNQVLEMDDDDERDFSREMFEGFYKQAEGTFASIEAKILERDLPNLSSLGHFLKGSSATLGLQKLRDSCEKIQHFGVGKDLDGAPVHDKDECLRKIKETVDEMKRDYGEIKKHLDKFYGKNAT